MPNKRTIPRTCQRCSVDFMANAWEVHRGRALYCSARCSKTKQSQVATIADDGLTAWIPLFDADGRVKAQVLIDVADIELVSAHRWYLSANGYAVKRIGNIRMHRMLLGLSSDDPLIVDHVNRDTLDNRRANLRSVTHAGNNQNKPSLTNSSSSYRGVTWDKGKHKWSAYIKINRKMINLGRFDDEHEAGRVALAARRRVMPYATD